MEELYHDDQTIGGEPRGDFGSLSNQPNPSNTNIPHYVSFPLEEGSTTVSGDKPHLEPSSSVNFPRFIPYSGDTENFDTSVDGQVPVNFPRFQESTPRIFIPKKTQRVLEQRISDERFRKIDPEPDVARELSLLILSNLSNTFYSHDPEGWKRLKSEYMRDQVSFKSDSTYRRILELLLEGTSNGPIIEEIKDEIIGKQSRRYRLSDVYRNKGVSKYELRTDKALQLKKRAFFQVLSRAMRNVIASNCIIAYQSVELPTLEQVWEEARRLAKEGFINKKGLILTYQGKHSKDEWKDQDSRCWLEEQVELFSNLVEDGLVVPQACGVRGGHRVIDSFTLMPSWARSMVKMNGQKTKEYDFSCLHPNIASKLFEGTGEAITHQAIADHLQIPLIEAKRANLTFFNAPLEQMKASVLWRYYFERETRMLSNLLAHRQASGMFKGDVHKATSAAMFGEEVKLMTDVISRLNEQNIHPLYIYDALMDTPRHGSKIIEAMNQAAKARGIQTEAK